MLVLSRKIQEQILIPGLNIRLTILSVGKNRVQLGIEAPKGIQITRPEVTRRSGEGRNQQVLDVECAGTAAFSGVEASSMPGIRENPAHDKSPPNFAIWEGCDDFED